MFDNRILQFAPWSISKVGQLEKCLRHYKFKYIEKHPSGPAGAAARIGSVVHAALEFGLEKNATDGLEKALEKAAKSEDLALTTTELAKARSFLPSAHDFVKRVSTFRETMKVKQVLIEADLAIHSDFTKASYSDKKALLRGKVDFAMITGDDMLVILDHKTGKKKIITEHMPQLYSYAIMGLASYPVRGVQCGIHYVGSPDLQLLPGMTADEIHNKLHPWLLNYLNSKAPRIEEILTGDPSPTVGWECEFCEFAKHGSCDEGATEANRRKTSRSLPVVD